MRFNNDLGNDGRRHADHLWSHAWFLAVIAAGYMATCGSAAFVNEPPSIEIPTGKSITPVLNSVFCPVTLVP